MKIHLIAAGTRPPSWIADGFEDYQKRFFAPVELVLHEIKTGTSRNEQEKRMLALIPKAATAIALEIKGQSWSTGDLAGKMQSWLGSGSDVTMMIGAAEGLAPGCLERADARWSLGPLTLPHMLVRVVVAEQLYRAFTLLNNHPYHRA